MGLLCFSQGQEIMIAQKRPVELNPRWLSIGVVLEFGPVARSEILVFWHLVLPPRKAVKRSGAGSLRSWRDKVANPFPATAVDIRSLRFGLQVRLRAKAAMRAIAYALFPAYRSDTLDNPVL